MTHCPRCHAPLPDPAEPFCPSCGADLAAAAPPPPPPPMAAAPPPLPPSGGYGGGGYGGPGQPAGGGGTGTPWERRGRIGLGSALVETTQQVYTDTANFFRSMSPTGGIGSPLLYAFIVGYIGLLASTVYEMVTRSMMGPSLLRGLGNDEVMRHLAPFFEFSVIGALANLFFIGPLVMVASLFIGSGITHVVLSLLGGATHGYEATFRTTCYAYAAMLLNIIPVCGGLLGALAMIVFLIIGLAEVHRTSKAKSAGAVLLPGLLCCCCLGLGIFGFVTMLANRG